MKNLLTTFAVFLVLSGLASGADIAPLQLPLPWNTAVPPLQSFLDGTPGSSNNSSWNSGNYNYGSSSSSSVPGHDVYNSNSGYGNYNNSNGAGYSIDPIFGFSLYAATYNWNQWGSSSSQTDVYSGPGVYYSFGPYSNEDHTREAANDLNVYSPNFQTFFIYQFLMDNGSDSATNGFCSSWSNQFGPGSYCSSSFQGSSWQSQQSPSYTLDRASFLSDFYGYTEPAGNTGAPEPATYLMVGGVLAIAGFRARRKTAR